MMQNADLEREMRKFLPELEIKTDEPMKDHTSFRIGGSCDLMLLPKSAEELRSVLRFLYEKGIRPHVFGAGSNVLVPDDGIRGVVIVTRGALSGLTRRDARTIAAQSGVTLAQLSMFAADCGLTGLEFAQGIPGTVGGGVFMNAGAYGGEIKDTAAETTALHYDGTVQVLRGAAQGFGYRSSAFQTLDVVIVETVFSLEQGDEAEIRAKMQDFAARRCAKQPLNLPSAGSTFKRPEGYFAAALIEEAGLKGLRIGDAAVSEKHAGFVVNLGNATAADVLALIEEVQKRVYAHSGVTLTPEVRLIRS